MAVVLCGFNSALLVDVDRVVDVCCDADEEDDRNEELVDHC